MLTEKLGCIKTKVILHQIQENRVKIFIISEGSFNKKQKKEKKKKNL